MSRASCPLKLLLVMFVLLAPGAGAQCELVKLSSPAGTEFDRFGAAVAMDADRAVVAEPYAGPGVVHVYQRGPSGWVPEALLQASDGGSLFGSSVAIDGDTIAVGDRFVDVTGGVYVFVRSGTSWSEQAKLAVPPPLLEEQFGASVAVSGDTIAVLAAGDTVKGKSGSAWTYERSGMTWGAPTALAPSSSAFHYASVAIDGDTIALGTIGVPGLIDDEGRVVVFARGGGLWSEQQVFFSPGFQVLFGTAVALAGDTIVAGRSGHAVLFSASVHTRTGTTWTESATLSPTEVADYNAFGSAVSLEGDRALVGATSGAAYVFERRGTNWDLMARLTPAGGAAGDEFGRTVAHAGSAALVGAPSADSGGLEDAGAAYLFDLDEPIVSYCLSTPNSSGRPALIGATGTSSLTANDLSLVVSGAPPTTFGLFFYGPTQVQVPFGDGFRCVGGATRRLFPPLLSSATGDFERDLDTGSPPLSDGPHPALLGATLRFQLWIRDPAGPGASGFNLSDGLSVTFCR